MAHLSIFAESVVAINVGLWFGGKRQRIRRLHRWRVERFAVDQPVQDVQDVRLGWRASLQRQFDGCQHRLLIMLKNQSQDLDHLAVTTPRLEHTQL